MTVQGSKPPVVITGMGVVSSIGLDIGSFEAALRAGQRGVHALQPEEMPAVPAPRVGGAVRDFSWSQVLLGLKESHPLVHHRAVTNLRAPTRAQELTLAAAIQASAGAGLLDTEPQDNVALVIAGSNLAQSYTVATARKYDREPAYIHARYGYQFLDTHLIGLLSSIIGLRGAGLTVGGAAASGNAALVVGHNLVSSGMAEACLVVGAVSDLSEVEWQGLRLIGATVPETVPLPPERMCRPFDSAAAGFVPGEGSGAVVIETTQRALARGAKIHATLVGGSIRMDGTPLPAPSADGEKRAMEAALCAAELTPASIGYINAHGTSTPQGDVAECQAIRDLFGGHHQAVWINSTKEYTGHTFTAAGVIELIATVVQLAGGFLHSNPNLEDPVVDDLRFVGPSTASGEFRYALSNSFGFAGICSSVVVGRYE